MNIMYLQCWMCIVSFCYEHKPVVTIERVHFVGKMTFYPTLYFISLHNVCDKSSESQNCFCVFYAGLAFVVYLRYTMHNVLYPVCTEFKVIPSSQSGQADTRPAAHYVL